MRVLMSYEISILNMLQIKFLIIYYDLAYFLVSNSVFKVDM